MRALIPCLLGLVGCPAEPLRLFDYAPVCDGIDEVDPPDAPTWSGGVDQVIAENCAGCHRDGGLASISLTSYEDAEGWSEAMGLAVQAGTMPPWLPSDCGDCGDWKDSRTLSPEDRALLLAWVEADAPAGDAPAEVEPRSLPTLARVDATLTLAEAFTPDASLTDDYRCFLVDPGLDADAFLTGFQLEPGDARMTHHAILYLPSDASQVRAAEDLDAADDGQGWTCFGGPGVDASFGAGWAPGVGAVTYPDGTGIPLAAQPAILQIHYNLASGAFPDQTRLDLMLEASVRQPAMWNALSQTRLELEPGVEAVGRSTLTPPLGPAKIWALAPHMHELGRSIQTQIHRTTGETECLIDVPDWDFHWQGMYFYEEPVDIRDGDQLELGCVYDTRSRDEIVDWGEGTSDEMCLVYAYLTIE